MKYVSVIVLGLFIFNAQAGDSCSIPSLRRLRAKVDNALGSAKQVSVKELLLSASKNKKDARSGVSKLKFKKKNGVTFLTGLQSSHEKVKRAKNCKQRADDLFWCKQKDFFSELKSCAEKSPHEACKKLVLKLEEHYPNDRTALLKLAEALNKEFETVDLLVNTLFKRVMTRQGPGPNDDPDLQVEQLSDEEAQELLDKVETWHMLLEEFMHLMCNILLNK